MQVSFMNSELSKMIPYPEIWSQFLIEWPRMFPQISLDWLKNDPDIADS